MAGIFFLLFLSFHSSMLRSIISALTLNLDGEAENALNAICWRVVQTERNCQNQVRFFQGFFRGSSRDSFRDYPEILSICHRMLSFPPVRWRHVLPPPPPPRPPPPPPPRPPPPPPLLWLLLLLLLLLLLRPLLASVCYCIIKRR